MLSVSKLKSGAASGDYYLNAAQQEYYTKSLGPPGYAFIRFPIPAAQCVLLRPCADTKKNLKIGNLLHFSCTDVQVLD
jgi:hypothetical protein